jgi:hypothetical protein
MDKIVSKIEASLALKGGIISHESPHSRTIRASKETHDHSG